MAVMFFIDLNFIDGLYISQFQHCVFYRMMLVFVLEWLKKSDFNKSEGTILLKLLDPPQCI